MFVAWSTWNKSREFVQPQSAIGANALRSWLGAMAQSNVDRGADVAPIARATCRPRLTLVSALRRSLDA
jgi:hypothetical protein